MNYFLHFILQACSICILFQSGKAYVLFAANLDDFKSIAKKFIPAKLADQLANMASPTSVKFSQKAINDNNRQKYDKSEANESADTDISQEEIQEKPIVKTKKRFSVTTDTKDINIDEIVERVKEKLEKEYKNYQNIPKKNYAVEKTIDNVPTLKHKRKPIKDLQKEVTYDNESNGNDEEQTKYYEEIVTKETETPNINAPKDNKRENKRERESIVEQPETAEIENLFHEIDMKKLNDSYEDYVTPKKDEIYENDEKTQLPKIPLNEKRSYNGENAQKVDLQYVYSNKWKSKEKITSTPNYNHNTEEIKAMTENLAYYDETEPVYTNQPTDNKSLHGNKLVEQNVNKKSKGTMIPTRETYKISSPNYYAKLPTIAVKYNFDEPIPERDREPENLKYYGNPPASVNRKVKL